MVNRSQVLVLLAAVIIIGAASHRILPADTNPAQRSLLNLHEVSAESTERQRILEELEEVHQLRERMLQEAGTFTSSGSGAPAPGPGLAAGADENELTGDSPPAESYV